MDRRGLHGRITVACEWFRVGSNRVPGAGIGHDCHVAELFGGAVGDGESGATECGGGRRLHHGHCG